MSALTNLTVTPNPKDEVFLEIEGTTLRCSRKELIRESDYFKAMFQGGFVESDKKTIKLKDVSFRAMHIIVTLFWDERYVVDSDDLLLVLEAACMLQFLRIKTMCVKKVLNEINTTNCFEIWRVCEFLDIRPLYLKAKAKALTEFPAIAQEDFIYHLHLEWFCRYVANRNLECQNEMEVFEACMRWFYENCEDCENKQEVLLVLLGCLDFRALKVHDIQEMKTYPDIWRSRAVRETLNCVIGLKENAILHCGDSVLGRARIYFESKARLVQHCPCFMAALRSEKQFGRHEKFVVHLCDPKRDKIRQLFEVDSLKISQYMRGYRVIAYREFLYVIGGQHELGLRDFVKSVWVYDLFREKWERSTLLPYCRRDFDVCISDRNLFVIGGSGEYASVQNNLFWYDCALGAWSDKVDLPVRSDDLKVCAYKNQLFLLSVPCARAYIFHPSTRFFAKIELCREVTEMLKENFALFNYKGDIYFKGKHLLRTRISAQLLTVVETTQVSYVPSVRLHSMLSDDVLYTFYVQDEETVQTCTLEKFNVEALHSTFIIDQHDLKKPLSVGGEDYYLKENPNLFLMQHYGLIEEDEYVTDYLLNVQSCLFAKD